MNTSDLIVRFTAIAALLVLAGCCGNDDNDCTAADLAHKNAHREWIRQHTTVPELVSETDGVKLYRIWTIEPSYRLEDHWTYFTVPCGDVNAELSWQEHHGNTSTTKHQQIQTAGGGCK